MAFGAPRAGTFSGQNASTPNNFAISGSQAVTVGDLIAAIFACENILTPTTCTDNLGNTYTKGSTANSGGFIAHCLFWSRATVGGTLTTLTFNSTSATDNCVAVAAVFEGLFDPSALDANPGNTTGDLSSPFNGPATGVLSQADELAVVCFSSNSGGATYSATSPLTKLIQFASSTNITAMLSYQVVAATTSITPAITGTNPTACSTGISTFKKMLSFAFVPASGALALSGPAPTLTIYVPVSLSSAAFRTMSPSILATPAFSFFSDTAIVPAAASLVLSGVTPTRAQAFLYGPAAGSLALAGTTPAAVQNLIKVPSVASLALAGVTPAELQALLDTPAAASLALTGVAPASVQNLIKTPTAASLAITGVVPAEVQNLIDTPSVASMALAGVAPIASVAQQYQPAARALTLTGVAPASVQNLIDAPAVAALALAGLAPTVVIQLGAVFLSPAAASAALTGDPPLLSQGLVDAPAAATASLTATAPAAIQNLLDAPAAASLAVSATTPTVVQSLIDTPAVASLSLIAAAPSVVQNNIDVQTVATLALSSAAPAVVQDAIKVPATASLALAATVPQEAWNYVFAPANLSLSGVPSNILLTGIRQSHFRFRTDTLAVDSTPTWAAAEDVNFNPGLPTFRLRVKIANTGPTDLAAVPWQIYASKNGGAYAPVTTTSTMGVKSVDAGASADETPINTELL